MKADVSAFVSKVHGAYCDEPVQKEGSAAGHWKKCLVRVPCHNIALQY